jgi:Flp pilus assembly pilin Flp
MEKTLKRLLRDEQGAEMTEYILIIALIAIFCIVAIKIFGGRLQSVWISMGNKLKGATD